MRLAYGAVQRKATLDWVLEPLARRPLEKLDPPVLAALRLGLYQLAVHGGTPDHAAVAESVELVKATTPAAHAFVNAVLRRAAREAPALLAALDDSTPAGRRARALAPALGRRALVRGARARTTRAR